MYVGGKDWPSECTRLNGLATDYGTMIEQAQPYHGRDLGKDLARLQTLSNTDSTARSTVAIYR